MVLGANRSRTNADRELDDLTGDSTEETVEPITENIKRKMTSNHDFNESETFKLGWLAMSKSIDKSLFDKFGKLIYPHRFFNGFGFDISADGFDFNRLTHFSCSFVVAVECLYVVCYAGPEVITTLLRNHGEPGCMRGGLKRLIKD